MKIAACALACAALSMTAACASTPKPAVSTTSTTSASLSKDDGKTAAERWAEQKVAAEEKVAPSAPVKAEATDPLADADDTSLPKIEMTPAKQVRAKWSQEFNAAMRMV